MTCAFRVSQSVWRNVSITATSSARYVSCAQIRWNSDLDLDPAVDLIICHLSGFQHSAALSFKESISKCLSSLEGYSKTRLCRTSMWSTPWVEEPDVGSWNSKGQQHKTKNQTYCPKQWGHNSLALYDVLDSLGCLQSLQVKGTLLSKQDTMD